MSVLTASQDGFNKVTKEVFEFRHAATDLTLALFVCCFRVANSPKQSRYPQFPMNFPENGWHNHEQWECKQPPQVYLIYLYVLTTSWPSLCVWIQIMFRCSSSSLVKSHPPVADLRPNEINRGCPNKIALLMVQNVPTVQNVRNPENLIHLCQDSDILTKAQCETKNIRRSQGSTPSNPWWETPKRRWIYYLELAKKCML